MKQGHTSKPSNHDSEGPDSLDGWTAAVPGPFGQPQLPAALRLDLDDAEHFDAAAAALVRASQVISKRSRRPIEATFLFKPGGVRGADGGVCQTWFLAVSIEPRSVAKRRSASLICANDLDQVDLAVLKAERWFRYGPGNWGRIWSAATDLGDVAVESICLARRLFDPTGVGSWSFGATVLAFKAGTGKAIADASVAVARHAIATARGGIPDDVAERHEACRELGLLVDKVFPDDAAGPIE